MDGLVGKYSALIHGGKKALYFFNKVRFIKTEFKAVRPPQTIGTDKKHQPVH